MIRARKTIEVAKAVVKINQCLAESTGTAAHREGLRAAIEWFLHDTGTYRGFRYLTVNEVPPGHLPGINISPIDGQHLEDFEARFANTDPTRVSYYFL